VVANATTTSSPFYVAADAINVYVADDGLDAILQYPVSQAGATPITLSQSSAFGFLQGIAVVGNTVVFTGDLQHNAVLDKSSIWEAQVGVPNQSLSPIDSFDPAEISAPAINGSTAYVMVSPEDSNGNHLTSAGLYSCRIGVANGCTSLVTTNSNSVGGPVVSGNAVFFDDFINNEVEKFPLPSGPLNGSFVSPLPFEPGIMAADSSRVYFAYNGSGINGSVTTAGIANNSTNGGIQPQGFGNLTAQPTGLASDGKFLYFAWVNYNNNPPTGMIQYAPVGGGAVSTLYSGSQPRSVVAANGVIYWVDGTTVYGQRGPASDAGTCSAGQTSCGGTCADLQSDAANCGSCGHGCIQGTCSAGVCQPWAVANATTTSSPFYVAADANNVYVADDGLDAILQYPVSQAGATPITLSQNSAFGFLQGIAVVGNTVVFTGDLQHNAVLDKSSIWEAQVGVPNQSLSPIDSFDPAEISAPAINGSTAYVMVSPEDSNGNHLTSAGLYSCPIGIANGCTSLVTTNSNSVGGPVVSGNAVFFDDFINNEVEKFPLPGGPLNGSYVSPLPIEPAIMAADSSRVYFAYNGSGVNGSVTTAGIANNSTNGGIQPQGFGNLTAQPTGLASDGKFLYFAWVNYNNNPPTGMIQYAPVGGGAVSTLYSGSQPRSVVASNGVIYWVDGTTVYGQRFP
jgi:hypothetical protein